MLYNHALTSCLCVCAVDRKKSGRLGTVADERPDLFVQLDTEGNMEMLNNHALTSRLCVCAVDRKKSGRRGTVAEERPDLVAQWDTKANGAHTPYNVTAGSPYKAAWRYKSLFALLVAQSLVPTLRRATSVGIQLHPSGLPFFRLQSFSELASGTTC